MTILVILIRLSLARKCQGAKWQHRSERRDSILLIATVKYTSGCLQDFSGILVEGSEAFGQSRNFFQAKSSIVDNLSS